MFSSRTPSVTVFARVLILVSSCLLHACSSNRAPEYNTPGARLIGTWAVADDLRPAWIESRRMSGSQDPRADFLRLVGEPTMICEFAVNGTCTVTENLMGKESRNSTTWVAVVDTPEMLEITTSVAETNLAAHAKVYFVDSDTIKIVQADPDSQPMFWRRVVKK